MLAEFDKLKIKSDILNEQMELLAQPVTKIDRRRTGHVAAAGRHDLGQSNPAALKASFTFAKKTSRYRRRHRRLSLRNRRRRAMPLPPPAFNRCLKQRF